MILNNHLLSDHTVDVMATAARIATESKMNRVGSEHLVMALCADLKFLNNIVRRVGFPSAEIDEILRETLKADQDFNPQQHRTLTPRMVRSFAHAQRIAQECFGCTTIEPHHLLLGILFDGESLVSTTLAAQGIIYAELLTALDGKDTDAKAIAFEEATDGREPVLNPS
jgi:ATP-dependent Clp protease ATP-binding subunit ClpA